MLGTVEQERHYVKTYAELKKFGVGTQVTMNVTVESKRYYSTDSEFGTYGVEDKIGDLFSISGIFPTQLEPGQSYELHGTVSQFKGEIQMKVDSSFINEPQNKTGIVSYLKLIDGVGDVTAKAIYDCFGTESIRTIKEFPHLIAEKILKVDEEKAIQWSNFLKEEEQTRSYMIELLNLKLTAKAARSLISDYGVEIVAKIKQNPYFLSDRVRGYSFLKCDEIAKELGIPFNDPNRVKLGILHQLKKISSDGHCYAIDKELIYKSNQLLQRQTNDGGYLRLNHNDLYKAAQELMQEEKIFLEKDRVYLKQIHEDEVQITKRIISLVKCETHYTVEQVKTILDEYLQEINIELEDEQYRACIEFNLSRGGAYILEGSAGTGKTFTLKIILEVAQRLNNLFNKVKTTTGADGVKTETEKTKEPLAIKLFAPTGKAAKVVAASSGMPATTIHRGLGYDPQTREFTFDENEPLPANVVVCDESSMLDTNLANSLFSAVANTSKLILMGDIKQLPSVKAGNVLKDLIESGVVPVVTLNVVKRQGLLSDILKVANDIIAKRPLRNYNMTNDAFIMERQTNEGTLSAIVRSIHRILTFDGFTLDEIQVLTCQRKGSLGLYRLNYALQEAFNPYDELSERVLAQTFEFQVETEPTPRKTKLYFTENDKVIHTQNNYDMPHYEKDEFGVYNEIKKVTGVMNGETGVIEKIESLNDSKKKSGKRIIVKYEEHYVFYEDDFDNLEHAWALTIHKSQGSAWKAVILPIVNQQWNMLDNSLLYTGWTRCRAFCVAVGQSSAMNQAVITQKSHNRNTTLRQRVIAHHQNLIKSA